MPDSGALQRIREHTKSVYRRGVAQGGFDARLAKVFAGWPRTGMLSGIALYTR